MLYILKLVFGGSLKNPFSPTTDFFKTTTKSLIGTSLSLYLKGCGSNSQILMKATSDGWNVRTQDLLDYTLDTFDYYYNENFDKESFERFTKTLSKDALKNLRTAMEWKIGISVPDNINSPNSYFIRQNYVISNKLINEEIKIREENINKEIINNNINEIHRTRTLRI